MTSPYSIPSRPLGQVNREDARAMRHAAGGDILDRMAELERRIERLEAQLKTH